MPPLCGRSCGAGPPPSASQRPSRLRAVHVTSRPAPSCRNRARPGPPLEHPRDSSEDQRHREPHGGSVREHAPARKEVEGRMHDAPLDRLPPSTRPPPASDASSARLPCANVAVVLRGIIPRIGTQKVQDEPSSDLHVVADPPSVSRPAKTSTGRKPGGQPGHKRHTREMFPPGLVGAVGHRTCEPR